MTGVIVSAVFEVSITRVGETRASNKVRLGLVGTSETIQRLFVFDTSSSDSRSLPFTDTGCNVEDPTSEASLGHTHTMGALVVLVAHGCVFVSEQTILSIANTRWLGRLCLSVTWHKEGILAALHGGVLPVIKY